MKNILAFLKDIWLSRYSVWGLAKNDYRAKYASTFLGAVWGIIQQLETKIDFS